jgi:hypothetical protein
MNNNRSICKNFHCRKNTQYDILHFGCKLHPSDETTNPDTIDQKYVDVCIIFLVSYSLGLMASFGKENGLHSETQCCVEYYYDNGKSSCKYCRHYSLNNVLISVLAKLWTSGVKGRNLVQNGMVKTWS